MTKIISVILACLATTVVWVFADEDRPPQDFPIAELHYKDHTEYFYLYSDYGFIAKWEDDETPRFFSMIKSETVFQ